MIAVLPSMIHPKQPFSDGLGGIRTFVYTSCAKDKEKGYQIVMPSF